MFLAYYKVIKDLPTDTIPNTFKTPLGKPSPGSTDASTSKDQHTSNVISKTDTVLVSDMSC